MTTHLKEQDLQLKIKKCTKRRCLSDGCSRSLFSKTNNFTTSIFVKVSMPLCATRKSFLFFFSWMQKKINKTLRKELVSCSFLNDVALMPVSFEMHCWAKIFALFRSFRVLDVDFTSLVSKGKQRHVSSAQMSAFSLMAFLQL